jgi:hypothetical protein
MMVALNFDSIGINLPEYGNTRFTPEQFITLPVNDRVKMVLRGEITFYNRGSQVDRRESLAALRKWSADKA